ncbi:MAG: RNA methyltransferase [Clostridia bacterium]|nr:RNA methyltransferase [Clostridia bacterium]
MDLPFKTISSRENATYKNLRALRQAKKAHEAGLILIEGFRQVEEALAAGIQPQWLIASSAALIHERWPALQVLAETCFEKIAFECLLLDTRLFEGLSATPSPQGVAIIAPTPLISSPAGCPEEQGLYLVLEGIQDPGNMGTMIRTADAFGFDGVILAGPAVDPFGDKALRSAMGSAFHIPVYQFPSILEAKHWLSTSQIPLVAAELSGETITRSTVLQPPAALAIGNEGAGLSSEALALADRRLGIDMPGRAESLNAASAAAILCHLFALGRSD